MGKHEHERQTARVRIFIAALLTASTITVSSYSYTPIADYDNSSEMDKRISWVWRECEKEGTVDYDKNGVVNCCDYATHFCIKWRRTYSESVRLCQQQTWRMNHMYVQIHCDWGWWSVDPRYSVSGTHDMKRVWGRSYSEKADNPKGYWAEYFMRYVYVD